MRIAMGIEYDGTAYNGWQKQNGGTGIQSVVEDAVSKVADKKIFKQRAFSKKSNTAR